MAKPEGKQFMNISSKAINKYPCSVCGGTGNITVSNAVSSLINGTDVDPKKYAEIEKVKCDVCNGTGRVDWITHVIDKKSAYLELDRRLKKAMQNLERTLIEYSKT